MSHQRANSTSSIGDRFPAASAGIDIPQRQRNPSATTAPLSISIPRQRSISSSFTLATSPRSFTTNNVFGTNPFFTQTTVPATTAAQTSPFAAAFAPLSPAQAPGPSIAAGGGLPTGPSSNIPVLHRRFSSSFNQLNQMVGSPPNATFQQKEEVRGRRTSMFAGSSPPASMMPPLNNPVSSSPPSSGEKLGLFRKFSTTGRTAGAGIVNGKSNNINAPTHPLDHNEPGPAAPPGSMAPVANQVDHQPRPMRGPLSKAHLEADKPADRPSRSSSPMRSMILNGQMLD
ncbi:hypothetical protein DFQ27_004962 [Actinomortierella ambigua]|uniref:Uncharacterized protein n=1 Tax=Actinomortierella ambigua TaxID=1343610 RepID=A0A9P6Q283_9FUNG|nr:hypothetical protein DFQ27_004962 [Actinomortierella ambigua]